MASIQELNNQVQIPRAGEKLSCSCGNSDHHIAFTDRNSEIVVECQQCLGFIKLPAGSQ